ncbi:MAG TPA: LysE family translocator, partial [Longimicrobiaceae bacterium]|nr:LysE family translocator [Longimicrobiaceae bacterium]
FRRDTKRRFHLSSQSSMLVLPLPTAATLLLFMTAGLALNVAPGPDMLYVIARSTAEGRRAGIVSSLGIAVGALVHMTLVAAGVSSLLLAVPLAYDVVRYAGAAYLVYLGVRVLLSRADAEGGARVKPAPLGVIFRQGVVTNVLNPKVALFFLAFLPQFVDPSRGSVPAQLVFLGLLFNLSGTTVNIIVALLASGAGEWSRGRIGGAAWLRRLPGVVFIALGIRLAVMRRA